MLFHDLKMARRIFQKNPEYSIINILGISFGVAVSLLIGLYIQEETSYDKYHQNYKQIYRLGNKVEGASFENGIAKVCAPWGAAISAQIPEVERVCRFTSFKESLFDRGKNKSYESGGFFVDSTVFEIFSWKLFNGDRKSCLSNPNSMVITKSFAEKYFGRDNPIGETITVDNIQSFIITGVMEDVPSNSHFHFDFLASMKGYEHPDMASWVKWPQFYTYLQIKPNLPAKMIESKIDNLLAQHLDKKTSDAAFPILQPISRIHLHSNLFREMETNGDIIYIYIFATLALVIIVIACLNFINLATVQSIKRGNEVGIRKVIGASQQILIKQYLRETLILVIIAMVFAITLSSLALPLVNKYLGTQLSFNWLENFQITGGLILLSLLITFLAGAYPAFVLSSFRPIKILGAKIKMPENVGVRKFLIVCQFTMSIVMIIAAIVSTTQLNYIRNKKLGFNKDQLIIVPFREPATTSKIESIKQELRQIAGVEMVSASANQPNGTDFGIPVNIKGMSPDRVPPLRNLIIDHDFLNTYQMQISAGRGFKKEIATDTTAYLINEEAAKQLGLKDPVGQIMEMPVIGREPAPIIGVVKDFHFRSLHEKISPLFFFIEKGWFTNLSIRVDARQARKAISQISEKWKTIEPAQVFTYSFFDQAYNNMYQNERKTTTLIQIFACIAIFIACLGLFGLAAFTATQRTKEIGVRKVLGATTSNIVKMLSASFIKLVIIAIVISTPIGWWIMNKWLEEFAYRIDMSWWIFAAASLTSLLIALLTISSQAIKAAWINPVKSLRSE